MARRSIDVAARCTMTVSTVGERPMAPSSSNGRNPSHSPSRAASSMLRSCVRSSRCTAAPFSAGSLSHPQQRQRLSRGHWTAADGLPLMTHYGRTAVHVGLSIAGSGDHAVAGRDRPSR